MPAPEPPPAHRDAIADSIEQGKRLIRIGGDKGLSLAEQLAERLNRLAWRTPLHGLRLQGKEPLKLVAVPDDPVLGDLARGQALLDGRIEFLGEGRAIAALNFAKPDWSPRFATYLHSFAWLRDLSSVATRAAGAPIAEHLARGWLAAHAGTISAPAWRPDLLGWRTLYWAAHAPLLLSSTDLDYRARLLAAMARGARHLDRSADKAPAGVGRVAAWCGVVTAGLLIAGGETRQKAGEAGLQRAIAGAVHSDGGNVQRAPAAQVEMITLLAMLREAYAARRLEPPGFVGETLALMVPALLALLHGDKALSSWQGAGPMAAEALAAVIEASGVRTRPLKHARDWGYQRLSSGNTVLILDAAPPPVARLADGGCASTLAFELSDGPHRLIVNCGGARFVTARLPDKLAHGLRTTAAHSTLVVGDSNSTAIHADGALGRGVSAVELSRQESETMSRIEASHDGYARRHGFVHRRQLVLSADGRELRGEDMLLPAGRRAKAATTPFAVRFHLGPGVQASPTADGQAAVLRLPGGTLWQFRCKGGTMAVEDSLWIDGNGRPVTIQQLVVSAAAAAGGANVSWALKRAR
ncbi:heparinase II/III family protein [Sphingomonas sp.]|uniref:heparinase II/III family protein n=1 Tax=Sphingomonas sp. TaxID=28214 RepID=UPI001D477F20|nr:heparinase II/III family protein [Sphingomonas sp.]MBX9796060.1 heparinase II/III family protein [Sphingomonas sp.]